MSSVQQNEIQMLNEYISALERQIKSNQGERQNLLQEVTKAQQNSSKYEIELRQVKNQLKQLSSVMTRQGVEKTNIQARVKILNDENDKLRKQSQLKEQRITQLTTTIKQKNEQIAKEKNSMLMTSNYHSKQVVGMEQKMKDIQIQLTQTNEQKNLLNYSLQSITQQLQSQKQQNQRLKAKNNFCETYIQSLEGKLKLSEKQNLQLTQQKQSLSRNLLKANQQITKTKKDAEDLQLRLIHGSQSSQESKMSYETFIKSLKSKHSEEVGLLNGDIERLIGQVKQLRTEIESRNQTIETLSSQLSTMKSNFEKEQQKNHDLSAQLTNLFAQLERVRKELNDDIASKQQLISTLQKTSEQWMAKWKRTQDELQTTMAVKYTNQQEYKFNLHEAEIKYQQELNQKEDKIDAMNNTINTQALEIEELKYHMNETKKRQQRLIQDVKKKQSDIETLNINLQMKREKIQQLSEQLSQTYQQLQSTTKDYQQKGRQGEQLSQKQLELMTQIENLKKEIVLLTKLKQEKNVQNKRLKTKIESLSEQLSENKKTQSRLLAQIKEQQQKLGRTLQDFTNTKQGSQKRLAQSMKRVGELERELQRMKKDFKQKQQLLKMLTLEYELKTREFANKQQQMIKKISQHENKGNKFTQKINDLQREMEKRQSDFNKALEKLIQQHSVEQQQSSHKHEQQIKQIQNKYFEQVNNMNHQLQQKMQQISQLQNSLTKYQFNTVQFSSNQSSMQKTIIMLQKQLQQAHQQINTYHEKLFSFNLNNDKTKELLLEKDIKIISLTALLEKAKKDNQRLLNEEIMLREQVAALETSTTYLKRQLTSTLERQQNSLKEIRSLQQANKSYSKLINSTSTSNLYNPTNGGLLNSSRTMEKHRTAFNVSGQLRRGFSMPQGYVLNNNIGNNNETIVEEVAVQPVVTQRKRDNRVLTKYSKPDSSTSIDSPNNKTIKEEQISFSKDPFDALEFVSSSVNQSRSSGGGNSSNGK